eukprot:350576-Chlamydomonas_euryale.AAC.6
MPAMCAHACVHVRVPAAACTVARPCAVVAGYRRTVSGSSVGPHQHASHRSVSGAGLAIARPRTPTSGLHVGFNRGSRLACVHVRVLVRPCYQTVPGTRASRATATTTRIKTSRATYARWKNTSPCLALRIPSTTAHSSSSRARVDTVPA